MQIDDWEKAQRVSDVTENKWTKCSDCGKTRRSTSMRVIDGLNICSYCFKKRIEEPKEEPIE